MKPKQLIPLVIVVAALLALVVWKQGSKPEVSIKEQAGLVSLLPDGLSKSDIAKVEIYSGAAQEEKLALTLDAEADKWRVASHFNAPVSQDKIDGFLKDLVALSGEPRLQEATDAQLEDFSLTDEKAFHVVGYKKDSEEAAFHLLVGKGEFKSVFMRQADGKDIYTEDTDLRQAAGIFGEDTSKAPEATPWLDKDILKVEDTDKIMKVALTYPDKALTFEKKEKPKAEGAEAKPEGGEGEGEGEGETKPEYEWTLASGGPGGEFKKPALDSLVTKFKTLTGTDVVDPAKKAEWGLEPPAFTCVLTRDGEPEIRIEGGRPDPSGDGYVRIADAKEDMVYKMSKYSFEQVFPKGTTFFDLAGITLSKESTDSIQVEGATGTYNLARSGETWSVASPACDLGQQSSTIDTIVTALTKWVPADFADAGADVGAQTGSALITAGGTPYRLTLFGKAKSTDGIYVRKNDEPNLLVMSQTDADKVLKAPKDLFELGLLDLDGPDLTQIQSSSDKGTFTLTREGETWKLNVNGEVLESDITAADMLADAIAGISAADVLFGKAALDDAPVASLQATAGDGGQFAFTFGPEKDGARQMALAGKAQVFTIDAPTCTALFPDLASLQKKAEESPASAEPAAEQPADAAAPETAPAVTIAPDAAAPTVEVAPVTPPAPVDLNPAAPTETAPAAPTVEVAPAPVAEPAPVEAAPAEPAPAPAAPAEAAPAETQQ